MRRAAQRHTGLHGVKTCIVNGLIHDYHSADPLNACKNPYANERLHLHHQTILPVSEAVALAKFGIVAVMGVAGRCGVLQVTHCQETFTGKDFISHAVGSVEALESDGSSTWVHPVPAQVRQDLVVGECWGYIACVGVGRIGGFLKRCQTRFSCTIKDNSRGMPFGK